MFLGHLHEWKSNIQFFSLVSDLKRQKRLVLKPLNPPIFFTSWPLTLSVCLLLSIKCVHSNFLLKTAWFANSTDENEPKAAKLAHIKKENNELKDTKMERSCSLRLQASFFYIIA